MSARSAKVPSLSDKIQGLKFMQRATASAVAKSGAKANEEQVRNGQESRQQTDLTETAREHVHPEEHRESEEAGERWTLSQPRVVESSAERRAGGRIVAEPGWNQWLGHLLDHSEGKEDGAEQSKESRMIFGTWAEARRKRKATLEDADGEGDDSFSASSEAQSDDERLSERAKAAERGFIKPGTVAKGGGQKRGGSGYGSSRKAESLKSHSKRRKH